MKEAIILFTKVPEVGAVKTRISKYWGIFTAIDAYQLYNHLLRDTASVIQAVVRKRGSSTYICYTPQEKQKNLKEALGSLSFYSTFMEQVGSDITERVRNAFQQVIDQGYDSVILIPGDHDDLDASTLSMALDCLVSASNLRRPQLVIGPTHDGGAYLIGLNRYTDLNCISNLDDSYRVCFNLIEYARTHALPFKILDVKMDIDDVDDLLRVSLRRKKLNTATERFLMSYPTPPSTNKYALSIIIPTLNEEFWVRSALKSIDKDNHEVEVILVDGGSEDNTLQAAANLVDKVVVLGKASRKMQENIGAFGARGKILLFLHADMVLQKRAVEEVIKSFQDKAVVAGSLDVFYDPPRTRYNFVKSVRLMISKIFNLHGVGAAFCVRRDLFYQLGGFDENCMEEGVALSQKLKKVGRLITVKAPVIVSARRFEKKGFIRTLILWALTVLLTTLGFKNTWLEDKFWKTLNKKQ
ncbi:MAG: DUF2064 domain-containing protein [Nitrososphaerales archaeon]